jgi:hypothetical protein
MWSKVSSERKLVEIIKRKEAKMQEDQESWDDDFEIEPEVWVQALLAMTGDKDRREELIRKISEKTGLVPEKVELIISATITYLANKTRSN